MSEEYCAIKREFAKEQLALLIERNPQVFKEYFTWNAVLNTDVNVTKEDTKEVKE